ncbi:DENN domain-containing protein 5 [Pelomyxa schiedti]|nr:DENN domain-containing protein 5 [Pelomyxa schiedti]
MGDVVLVQPNRFVDYFLVVSCGPTLEVFDVHHELPLDDDAPMEPVVPVVKDCWNARFKGALMSRVPAKDYPDSPLPDSHVWMFCFPRGIKLEQKPQRPTFTLFALTQSDGSRFYAVGLIVYQPFDVHPPLPPSLSNSHVKGKMYIPTCLCILSHYPFFSAFKVYLKEIFRASRVPSRLPMETLVESLLYDVPLPPQGHVMVRATLPSQTLELSRPSKSFFEMTDFDIKILFDCIGIEAVVDLFGWVLEERHILFTSSQHSILTIASEIIMALIYPFQWSHVYIPNMNITLRDYLHAPTPYIMGFVRDHNEPTLNIPDVIVIDLDKGCVHNRGPATLPLDLRAELIARLKKILHPNFYNLDQAYPDEDLMNWVFDKPVPPSPTGANLNTLIQSAFLLFFIPMFKDYHTCFQAARKYPRPRAMFDKPKFLSLQQPSARPFLESLFGTISFHQFAEKFFLQSENIFDLSIYHYKQGDTELSFLTSGSIRDTVSQTYDVPPLWACSTVPTIYPTFPPLSDALINKARTSQVLTTPKEVVKMPYFREEPNDVHYLAAQAMPEFGQPQIDFMDKIIDTIISSKTPSVSSLEQLSGLIGVTEGAIMFVHRMVQYTTTKNPDCCLSDGAFVILSDAFKRVLTLSFQQLDFRAPGEFTKIANVYYHRVGGLPEFLSSILSTCEIWKHDSFWEFTFFNDLQRRRADLPLNFRTTLDDWETIAIDQREASVQQEEDLLFKAIASLILSMTTLAGTDPARHFISGISNFASLSNRTIEQLNSFQQNTSNANTRSTSLLQSIKIRNKHESAQDNTRRVFDMPAQKAALREEYERVMQVMNVSGRATPAEPTPTVNKGYAQAGTTFTSLQGYSGGIECTCFRESRLVCGHASGHVAIWDTEACVRLAKMPGHKDKVTDVHFNGNDIVSSSDDKTLRIWDSTGKEKIVLNGHTDKVCCCEVSPTVLASGSWDHTVRLWDPRIGTSTAELKGHSDAISCLQLGHRDSNSVVISGSADKSLRVWDLRRFAAPLHVLNDHRDWVKCIATEGNIVISGSYDNTVKMWDIKNGKCKRTLTGHEGAINCMSFDAANNRLWTGSGDRTVRLWNTTNGQLVSTLSGHNEEVTCLATFEDWVVTSSFDQTVCIWEPHRSPAPLKTLRGHSDWIKCLHVVSKKKIISGSWDSTIKLWYLD